MSTLGLVRSLGQRWRDFLAASPKQELTSLPSSTEWLLAGLLLLTLFIFLVTLKGSWGVRGDWSGIGCLLSTVGTGEACEHLLCLLARLWASSASMVRDGSQAHQQHSPQTPGLVSRIIEISRELVQPSVWGSLNLGRSWCPWITPLTKEPWVPMANVSVSCL